MISRCLIGLGSPISIVISFSIEPRTAVIVTVPLEIPVTTPNALTVAIVSSDDVNTGVPKAPSGLTL